MDYNMSAYDLAMDSDSKCGSYERHYIRETANIANGSGVNDINLVNFTALRPLPVAIPVYGYLTPCLLLITFFTNSVVVAVLSRPHMKSPSNFILCAMAMSDLCTLGTPVPMFIYQYTLGFHARPVPCYLAVLDFLMTDLIPTICHSASIWLTLMLAVQRYIYVCHPGKARIWCTIPRVTFGTLVIYSSSIIYNFPRLFERSYIPVYTWNCKETYCFAASQEWSATFMPAFYSFRIIAVNVIPCFSLVVLNTFLVISLNQAQANRKRLFRERKQESSKQRDSNGTTMMLVAVVFVFLAVELPLACIMSMYLIAKLSNMELIPDDVMGILITFSNLCIALSYSIYFPIYCSMSRQFRETFKELFIKAKQFTHDTRNGVRLGSIRRRNNGPLLENGHSVYISTADNEEYTYNRTVVAQVSNTANNSDEGTKENETLL